MDPRFLKPRLFSRAELLAVPVAECGDPMVDIVTYAPEIRCEYLQPDMLPYTGGRFLLRQRAADRLRAAARSVRVEDAQSGLKLVYAYRHPEVQARYFEAECARLGAASPQRTREEIADTAHLLAADPAVAGHPTGGAVDVTIVRAGIEVPMGTPISIAADPEKLPFFAPGLSELEQGNRARLRRAMIAAGFAPFDGEWWHFCYGDREWAASYGESEALFSPVAIAVPG